MCVSWPAHLRPLDVVWMGSMRRDRQEMIAALGAAISPEKLDLSLQDDFGGSIGVFEYSNRMRRAVFAPCPFGNSDETHRFSEALFLGCIPVMLNSTFVHALYETPNVLLANDWSEAASLVTEKRKDHEYLITVQRQLQHWHEKLIQCMQADMQLILNRAPAQRCQSNQSK